MKAFYNGRADEFNIYDPGPDLDILRPGTLMYFVSTRVSKGNRGVQIFFC